MKRILLIHNIAWSHYKALVFNELNKIMKSQGLDMLVIQIALTERGRKNLGSVDLSLHQHPHKILFNAAFEETSAFSRTVKTLKEMIHYRPDIVVLPGYFDISFWAAFLFAKMLGIKIIAAIDSTEFDKRRIWYKEWPKRIFIKYCNAIFSYGIKSKEYAVKLGMPADRVFIRTQATDYHATKSLWGNASQNRNDIISEEGLSHHNFIYVGRLSEEKNIQTLIRAFHSVKGKMKEADEWGLIIVGDGQEGRNLKALVSELNLGNVYFIGSKPWDEIPKYYALADVFILPSISEPWGLVVNEAMICGLPVMVSNRCGAAYDLVREGENGFTFDPYNIEELTSLMNRFVGQEVDMANMGEKSREIIADYTPEHAADQMFKGIKFVLDNK